MAFVKGYSYKHYGHHTYQLEMFNTRSLWCVSERDVYLTEKKGTIEEKRFGEDKGACIRFNKGNDSMIVYLPFDKVAELMVLASVKGDEYLLDLTDYTDPRLKDSHTGLDELPSSMFKKIVKDEPEPKKRAQPVALPGK